MGLNSIHYVLSGTGSPEGVVTAPVGTVYTRTNGSTSTTMYVKESGTGNTGWIAYGSALPPLGSVDFEAGPDGTVVFDGAATILGLAPSSSVYTLTRDIFPLAITINVGVTIKCGGFAIFTRTLTNNGKITDNGAAASGTTGGVGVSRTAHRFGSTGSGGTSAAGDASNFSPGPYVPSAAGGAGGGPGVAGSVGNLLTGGGGGGGDDGSGRDGGATVQQTAQHLGASFDAMLLGYSRDRGGASPWSFGGGGGAGGNSGFHPGTGGGGGAPGGCAAVCARTINGTGTIEAKGGDGGAPTGAGGGGGGGAGGLVLVKYFTNPGPNTFVVTGGVGAAGGTNNAKAGANGGTGLVVKINLSLDGT